jgi:hypothetical protein
MWADRQTKAQKRPPYYTTIVCTVSKECIETGSIVLPQSLVPAASEDKELWTSDTMAKHYSMH